MKYDTYRRENPEFITELAEAKRLAEREVHMLKAVSRKSSKKAVTRQRKLVHLLLKNDHLRLWCAWKAVKKLKAYADFPPERLRQLASGLTPGWEISEDIFINAVRKNGKVRPTESFGPQRRACQFLVCAILEAIHNPLALQFSVGKAKGMPTALRTVAELVRQGYVHGRELDITNFYPSILADSMYALLKPLPRCVIEHTVMMSGHADRVRARPRSIWVSAEGPLPTEGLPGLSQGSVCSNIAAQFLMTLVLRKLPDSVRAVSYGDNIMLMGLTPEDVEQGTTDLVTLLQEHLASPSVMKGTHDPILDLRTDRMVFMKQVGDGRIDGEGEFVIDWAPGHHRFEEIFAEIENPNSTIQSTRALIKRLNGWRHSYPWWSQREPIIARWIAQLKIKLLCRTTSTIQRVFIAREVAAYWLLAGPDIPLDELLAETDLETRREAERVIRRQLHYILSLQRRPARAAGMPTMGLARRNTAA